MSLDTARMSACATSVTIGICHGYSVTGACLHARLRNQDRQGADTATLPRLTALYWTGPFTLPPGVTRMPLHRYGVLKCQATDRRLATSSSPHYQVRVTDGARSHRIAVNVRSQLPPSEVLYFVDENFNHPVTSGLGSLGFGFTQLPSAPGGSALDFIRGNLFDTTRMTPLPLSGAGDDDDLNEKLDRQVQAAMTEEDALIYAFGEQWGPETQADRYFGFQPGHGIHDIHMNQGNVGRFVAQDGVWQDGALLFHFPSQQRWAAIFLAFQSQAFHTDDTTGHRLETTPEQDELPVAIIAALVNSAGDETVGETVMLINRRDQEVVLDGWNLADKDKRKKPLAGVRLAPHGTATVRVRQGSQMQLSNNGGIVTLSRPERDQDPRRVYTKEQASREGWLVLF